MSTATEQQLADATGIDPGAIAQGASIKSVYVYEAPVRLWHWINAASITVLALTGIGTTVTTARAEDRVASTARPSASTPTPSCAGASASRSWRKCCSATRRLRW